MIENFMINSVTDATFIKSLMNVEKMDIGLNPDMSKREIYEFIDVSYIQNDEKFLALATAYSYALMLSDHPAVESYFILNGEEKQKMFDGIGNGTYKIQEFVYIFSKILNNFQKSGNFDIEDVKKIELLSHLIKEGKRFDIEQFNEIYKVTENILKESINAFSILASIERASSKRTGKDSYAKYISVKNKEFVDVMKNAYGPLIGKNDTYFFESERVLNIIGSFEKCISDLDFTEVILENEQRKQQEEAMLKSVKKEPVVHEISEKEKGRISAIKKANDMYDSFVNDFLVDLQKDQVYSNMKGYGAIIDKFEKFIEKNPMPLSSDVSQKTAELKYYQLSKIIDDFYQIRDNAIGSVEFKSF